MDQLGEDQGLCQFRENRSGKVVTLPVVTIQGDHLSDLISLLYALDRHLHIQVVSQDHDSVNDGGVLTIRFRGLDESLIYLQHIKGIR